jgi:protein-L-isoaspartate(D-aspartate) O-methyltransferase
MGLHNITVRAGDGSKGWPEQAPFSRIIVTAAALDVPATLLDQLDEGGIMVVPVGLEENLQHLLRIRKLDGDIETEDLGPVRFVPLISDEDPA